MISTKRALLVIAALAVLAAVLSGCGGKVVAKVNGQPITKEEYYKRLERVAVPVMVGGRPVQQEAGILVLNDLINEKIIQELAKKENVTPTEEQIDYKWNLLKKSGNLARLTRTSGYTEEEIRKQIAAQQAFINVATKGIKITDEEVKKFFESNPQQFKQPERVQVRIITTEKKERIEKAADLLKKNIPFDTVARDIADNPADRQAGGIQLVLFKGMKMPNVPPEVLNKLVEVGFKTKKGQTSPPFLLQGRWVILKTEDILPAVNQTLPEMKQFIRENLALAKAQQENKFPKKLAEFDKKAEVVIEIERYRTAIKNLRETARGEIPTSKTSPVAGTPAAPTPKPR